MRFMKTAVLAGVVMAFVSPSLACDKDKTTAKVEQSKQQTAQTNHQTQADQSKQGGGG